MAKEKEQTSSESKATTRSEQEIERIREIVFGTQMRQYASSIAMLQQDVERLGQEVANLNGQLAERDASQAKTVQALRQEFRDADQSTRNDLRLMAQQVEDDKMGRDQLSGLFIELGNQIKEGGSLANLLQNLLEPK